MKTIKKLQKDDLLLIVSSKKDAFSSSEEVPKNTENLIQEAEISLKNSQEQASKVSVKKPTHPKVSVTVNVTKCSPQEAKIYCGSSEDEVPFTY